jgi:hypothetical protein
MKSIFQQKYLSLLIALLLCMGSGCGKKERSQARFEPTLREPVQKILQAAKVDLYPGGTLLNNSASSREYRKPSEAANRPIRYVSVANVLMTADVPLAKIREYYQKKCPYDLTGQTETVKNIQLSSVKNIAEALAGEVSPIILVDIRQPLLPEPVITAYRTEMAVLKNKSGKDLAAQRRIRQLENLIAQNPLIRVSVREITSIPVSPENKSK